MYLSLINKVRYIRGSTSISECVKDIVPATRNWDCTFKAAAKGSYAYVYVVENETCHICVHSRNINNRTLEQIPTSGNAAAYQRGTTQ